MDKHITLPPDIQDSLKLWRDIVQLPEETRKTFAIAVQTALMIQQAETKEPKTA